MASSLLWQGLELMVFGMGTVLVFLTLLVLVTTVMSRIARRLELPAPASPPLAEPSAPVLAAIAAAIHAHRETRSK